MHRYVEVRLEDGADRDGHDIELPWDLQMGRR